METTERIRFLETNLGRQGRCKLGRVVLDSTKMKANASKHKAMSYQWTPEAERRLRREVREILAEAERVDQEEDARWGDKRGGELPAELARRASRWQKIRAAKKALEQRARAQTRAAGKSEEQVQKAKPQRKDQLTVPSKRFLTH